MLSIALFGLGGMAQGRNGNGQGKGHQKKTEKYQHDNRGKGNKHYAYAEKQHSSSNRTVVTVNRRNPSVTYAYSRPVYHNHGRERNVYVSVRPGIRYVRHYTVRPRAYVVVRGEYGRDFRREIISLSQVDEVADKMNYTRGDERRLQVAKDMLWNKMLYAEDVAYLMQFLDYDEHRLELAKFSFRRTVDPENFYLVKEELKFKENRRELDRFTH